MGCVLFCLLAVCAFQKAFADKVPPDDLENLYTAASGKLSDASFNLNNSTMLALDGAVKKEVKYEDVSHCWAEYKSWTLFPENYQCKKCRDKARKDKDVKSAKKCYAVIVDGVRKTQKSKRKKIQKCADGVVRKMHAGKKSQNGGKEPKNGGKEPQNKGKDSQNGGK